MSPRKCCFISHLPTGTSQAVQMLAASATQRESSSLGCAHYRATQSLRHTERGVWQLRFCILVNHVIFNFIHCLVSILGICS